MPDKSDKNELSIRTQDVGAAHPVTTVMAEPVEDSAVESAEAPGGRSFGIGTLWRYKWTIVIVFIVTAPLFVAGVWFALEPVYRADSLVHVRSKLHHLTEAPEDGRGGPWGQYERYLRSQVQIIKSAAVLERLKDREDVRRTSWYDEGPSALDQLLGKATDPYARLSEQIAAGPVHKTELIQVSMESRNPSDAAAIVNALVAEYVSFVGDEFSEEDRKLLEELQSDERELSSAIALAERTTSEARRKLGTGSSADALILQQRVRLDQLQGELEELALQIRVRNQEIQNREQALAESDEAPEPEVDMALVFQDDPEWARLNGALKDAERRLAAVSDQFQEKHPTRERLEREVGFARQALADREAMIERMVAAGMTTLPADAAGGGTGVAALKEEVRLLEARQDLVQQTMDRLTQEYSADFEAAETLRTESTKIDRLTSRLNQVHQRQRELLEKGRVPPAIKVIARATPPSMPSNADKRRKLLLGALAGAFGLGLASAYLRFLLDPKVSAMADVRNAVRSPFLGYLPLIRDARKINGQLAAEQVEAMRSVRTALLNRVPRSSGNIVQITSVSQGSGKSTTSVLLARSMAQLGKRVLLVDADVRRPSLASHFELNSDVGLLTLLRDDGANPNTGIYETELPQLNVLPAGRVAGLNDYELLANGKLSALLESWRGRYDVTILDGPPLVGTADAAILSRQVDGTILVVREGHCRRNMLSSGLTMFQAAGGRLLGTIFVGNPQHGALGYGYSAYGYGETQTSAALQMDVGAADQAENGKGDRA